VLEIVSILLGIFSFGSIGWFGLDSALEATRVKEYYTGVIDVPIWLSKWIIPIGCLAYCLELLFDGMRLILMIKNPLLYNQPLK
jgi:TRAP-type C4-dicarboxylate transport system permease small subunit